MIETIGSDRTNSPAIRDPSRNDRPPVSMTISFDELVAEITKLVQRRNRFAPRWANPGDSAEG